MTVWLIIIGAIAVSDFIGTAILINIVKELCETMAEIMEGKYRGQI